MSHRVNGIRMIRKDPSIAGSKVLLIFPPKWSVSAPFLAIPMLASYLKAHGVSVKVRDLNVGLLRWVFSAQGSSILTDAIRHLVGIRWKADYEGILNFARWARTWMDEITDDHKNASRILREHVKYTIKEVYGATLIIERAWKIIDVLDEAHSINADIQTPHRLYIRDSLEQLSLWKPDVIGFSAPSHYQLLSAIEMAGYLKHIGCEAGIVAGGTSVTSGFGSHFSESSFPEIIDCCVVGRGEEALIKLLQMRKKGTPWPKRLRGSYPPKDQQDPLPDYSDLIMEEYFQIRYDFPYPFSRGCRWRKCRFCGLNCTHRYRVYEPERMIQQIASLHRKYGCVSFENTGSELSPHDASAISDSLKKSNLNIRWKTMARAENGWTESLCRDLTGTGFHHIEFGIESLSDPILELMGKGISSQEQLKALDAACKGGLKPMVFLMYDYPGERIRDLELTLDLLSDYIHALSSIHLFRFHLDRGSILAANETKYGIKTYNKIFRSIEHDHVFRIRHEDLRRDQRHLRDVTLVFDQWIHEKNKKRSLLFLREKEYFLVLFDITCMLEKYKTPSEPMEDYFILDEILERKYRVNDEQIRRPSRNNQAKGYYLKCLLDAYDNKNRQFAVIRDLEKGSSVREALAKSQISPQRDIGTFNSFIQMINGLDMLNALIPRETT